MTRFEKHGKLRVASSGRHLEHENTAPFFLLADTVWNGPLKASDDDWETFLEDRQRKGFIGIQFISAAPWRAAPTDGDGQAAFDTRQNIALNEAFFDRMDRRIEAINRHDMVAMPVLVWGCTKDDPGQYLPEADLLKLVQYQVQRFDRHAVIWIPVGDGTYTGATAERWKRIGRAVFGAHAHQPVILHPAGMIWPHDEFVGEDWIDMLGYQSGHSVRDDYLEWIHSGPPAQAWRKTPPKPIVNLEPPYEEHVGYFSNCRLSRYDVRRAGWWSILSAPPAGITYGAHGIWSWEESEALPMNHPGSGTARPWHVAKDLPGATDYCRMARFLSKLPWWKLRPDDSLLRFRPGATDPARYISVCMSEDRRCAVVYLPLGLDVTLDLTRLAAPPRAEWFNPRSGAYSPAVEALGRFRAPDAEDWVLLLQA